MLRWQFNLSAGLGFAALLLAIANAVLATLNRDAQAALNERQQFVQQTAPLEGLYREIVKALAERAVKGNDQPVLQMLAAQGLSITVNPPPTSAGDAVTRKSEKTK
jgi:hypothetical protein